MAYIFGFIGGLICSVGGFIIAGVVAGLTGTMYTDTALLIILIGVVMITGAGIVVAIDQLRAALQPKAPAKGGDDKRSVTQTLADGASRPRDLE